MTLLIIFLIIIHWVIFHYTFEFQRVTLTLSRIHFGRGEAKYQALLSPNKISTLAFFLKFIAITTSVVIGYTFGWWVGVVYFILTFFLGIFSWFGFLIPFPRAPHCFDLIEKHLSLKIKEGDKHFSEEVLRETLRAVQVTRLKENIDLKNAKT